MKKTFYSVQYRRWGAIHPETRWFDNKEDACRFAMRDYHDRPVAHTYRRLSSISRMEELVKEQKAYESENIRRVKSLAVFTS